MAEQAPPQQESITADRDILTAAEAWLAEGRRVALARVVSTWGSAPRPAGSMLLIDDRMNMLGSVSGGCVEGAVVEEAQAVLAGGRPKLLEYGVTDDTAWAVGLACGGTIKVFVEAIS